MFSLLLEILNKKRSKWYGFFRTHWKAYIVLEVDFYE